MIVSSPVVTPVATPVLEFIVATVGFVQDHVPKRYGITISGRTSITYGCRSAKWYQQKEHSL
jgi:hypothetical protein